MTTNSAIPFNQRYFEDYVEGATSEYGEISLTADEIMEFARRYDPQPIHVDPEVRRPRSLCGTDRQRLAHCRCDDASASRSLYIARRQHGFSRRGRNSLVHTRAAGRHVVDPRYGPGNQTVALEARSGNRAQPRRGTKSKQRSCHEPETGEHGEMPHLTPRNATRSAESRLNVPSSL